MRLEFKGICLKQDKAPFTPNNAVKLYIAYKLNVWSQDLNAEFTLKYQLFGNVKITKIADTDNILVLGKGTTRGLDNTILLIFQDQKENFV